MSRRQLLIWSALSLVTGYSAPCFAQPVDAVTTQGRAWANAHDEFCDHPNTGRPYLFMDGCLDADLTHYQIGGPWQSYHPRYVADAWSVPLGLWDIRVETQWGPAGMAESVAVTLYHIPTPDDPERNRIVGRWFTADVEVVPYIGANYALRETLHTDGNEYPGSVEFVNAYGFSPADADLRVYTGQLYTSTPPVTIDGLHHGARIAVSAYIFPARLTTDIDENGVVDTADIFAFLALWFAGDDFVANWDGQDGVQPPDIFAFLSDFFEDAE